MCQPSVLELKYTRLRRTGESRYPDVLEFPGFRVALAIASLPGMTMHFCCEL